MSQLSAHLEAEGSSGKIRALREKFIDGRVVGLILVLYFPVVIAARWYTSEQPSVVGGLVEAVVTAVAWFCLAWVVGWVCWRATRGQSAIGQKLFGASLLVLMLSSTGLVAVNRPRMAAAEQSRYRGAAVAMLEFYEQAIEEGDIILGEGDALVAFASAMERRALGMEDEEERALTLTGAALMREQAPLTDTVALAAKALRDAGGLDPNTLRSRRAIEERLALAREFLEASETLKRSQVLMRERFRHVAALYGVPGDRIADSIPWLERVFGLHENAELAALEARSARAAVTLLRILHEEFGRWGIDPSDGTLDFRREGKAEAYLREKESLRDAETRKRLLQRRILAENRERLNELGAG